VLYKYTKAGPRPDDRRIRYSFDPGRLAFGQTTRLATPLQMAMVPRPSGNGGIGPKPIRPEDRRARGSTVRETHPGNLGRAIKPETRPS